MTVGKWNELHCGSRVLGMEGVHFNLRCMDWINTQPPHPPNRTTMIYVITSNSWASLKTLSQSLENILYILHWHTFILHSLRRCKYGFLIVIFIYCFFYPAEKWIKHGGKSKIKFNCDFGYSSQTVTLKTKLPIV